MSRCKTCNQEMSLETTVTCRKVIVFDDGEGCAPVAYPYDADIRCYDCGIDRGGWHHPGCDQEICPRCGGQFISCDCVVVE